MLSTHTLSVQVQVQVPSTTSLWSALNSVITKIPNYKQSVQKQVKKIEKKIWMSIIRLFWPNKKFSLVLGRYTEIPYRYPIFWNIDTDADVGIRNTEKYRIPTIKYRKYRFGICLQWLRFVFILLLDESQVRSELVERNSYSIRISKAHHLL